MNSNLVKLDGNRHDLSNRDSTQVMVNAGRERIQDLVRQSTMSLQEALAEVRETIARTEAEMEIAEKISIVVERDRTVLSVERNFRFAKDK